VLYPDEDEESVGRVPEAREPKLPESPRSASSSPKVISAIDGDSAEVIGRYGVDIPGETVEGHPVVFRSQYGESREPAFATSIVVGPPGFFLELSGVGSDISTKYGFVAEGEIGGEAKGEGSGVSWGDLGTLGNRASLSVNFPTPCTEGPCGTSRIFPSST